MAKGDQEVTQNTAQKQAGVDSTAMGNYTAGVQSRIGSPATTTNGITTPATGLLGQQQQQLDQVSPQFSSFAGSGGIDENTKGALGSGAGSIANNIPGVSDEASSALGNGTDSIANSIGTPDYSAPAAGYSDLSSTGGVNLTGDQASYKSLQQPNATNAGIVNQLSNTSGLYGDTDSAISKLNNTSPLYSGVNNNIASLNNIASTGGVSDSDIANINRPELLSVEQNGGYSDQDIANIKKESNSVIPSYYSSLQDSLARQKAVSGYGPGFSAATAAAARQGAVDSGNQALNTDVSIGNTVRDAKVDAAKTLATNQIALSNLTSTNRQNALSTAGNLGNTEAGQTSTAIANAGNLANTKAGQQTSALESAGQLNSAQQQIVLAAANGDVNAQQIIQSGKLAGLAGLTGITTAQNTAAQNKAGLASTNMANLANLQNSNAVSKAQLASSNVSNLAGMTQQGQEYGTSGLANLYQSSTNQLSQQDQQLLNSLGMSADQQAKLLDILRQNGAQQGSGSQGASNWMSGIGAAAGIAAMFL